MVISHHRFLLHHLHLPQFPLWRLLNHRQMNRMFTFKCATMQLWITTVSTVSSSSVRIVLTKCGKYETARTLVHTKLPMLSEIECGPCENQRCSFFDFNHAIFDTLNIDYIGPFPDKGYILVIIDAFVTRTPVRAVRVQAYVRTGSRTIRSIRFIAMIPAVFTCKLTTLFP